MAIDVLSLWTRLSSKPAGKWLFSRLVCLRAPYFASISPTITELRPGYCRVQIRKHRSVLNHIGSVHAIAMCNMAEVAGGMLTEVSVPRTHRWIPKGMAVQYLKKATTDLVAIAEPVTLAQWPDAGEFEVNVKVEDRAGEAVFNAVITMWVSLKKIA
ncbi:hotdog fold domain-containing protein [Paraburkholderia megapolitana]|uniref:hotdog fold domain-containing protein n=1 Tax=Paraburkholderia megapolitana TaxID=420953 RepID=UPI0038B8937A